MVVLFMSVLLAMKNYSLLFPFIILMIHFKSVLTLL